MTRSKSGKSVISGIFILLLSISMLIGITYAMFSDSSSTSVNTIQAGTLDIDLVDASGSSLDGETVDFVYPEGSSHYWEPGRSYQLEPIKIKNKGNLDLKYKIEITDVNGTEVLDDYLSWTVKVGETEITDLANYTATLAPNAEHTLTIIGNLGLNAGIDVMSESASGISITVRAIQTVPEAQFD